MRYLVLIPDGMADYACPSLGGKTPMEAANKPVMNSLAKQSLCGSAMNVPAKMVPESDTANLAILSYDPTVYSKGRSPLEAVSMGLSMADDDMAIRCNVVTLSEEENTYAQRHMLDHSADEISTEEAAQLIQAVDASLGDADKRFFTGISYRHCLLWRGLYESYPFARPHDIIGQQIGAYLPQGAQGEKYLSLMEQSYEILENHPVNQVRRSRGLRPANSIWLWSPGAKPSLPSFRKKWGLRACVISAVDLIKGIGLCAGMDSIDVPGATGNIHTNFDGKAQAAMQAFDDGYEFVYVHVEAPDECGHRGEIENKVKSIELIDTKILSPCLSYLQNSNEPFRIMVLPDHPTPLCKRTHTHEAVPFFIYDSELTHIGVPVFSEASCARLPFYVPQGDKLLAYLIGKDPELQ